jgi:VWFA-related protein
VSIEDVPVSMMLALDVSTSVADDLDDLRSAVQVAIDTLQPGDRAALLVFSEVVQLAVPWTSRTTDLASALSSATAGGGTSLYDGTYAALTLRDEEPGRRALLLVLSDGVDTSSWLPDSVVSACARRTDVVAYTVGLQESADAPVRLMSRSGIELLTGIRSARTAHEFLNEIAESTGGAMYAAENTRALRDRFTRIIREFRSRYVLTYSPRGVAPDGWHRLDVRLKDRRGEVKARRGYLR